MINSDDSATKVGWKTVGLDHPLVEKALAFQSCVMLHREDRRGRGHHYVQRRDDGGWYIRCGKRGTVKKYLDRCEITYIDGEPSLFQFRTAKPRGED